MIPVLVNSVISVALLPLDQEPAMRRKQQTATPQPSCDLRLAHQLIGTMRIDLHQALTVAISRITIR